MNTLAVIMAGCLSEEELELAAVVLTQLSDTLNTIAVQRQLNQGQGTEEE